MKSCYKKEFTHVVQMHVKQPLPEDDVAQENPVASPVCMPSFMSNSRGAIVQGSLGHRSFGGVMKNSSEHGRAPIGDSEFGSIGAQARLG
jgi:hypothetical protein